MQGITLQPEPLSNFDATQEPISRTPVKQVALMLTQVIMLLKKEQQSRPLARLAVINRLLLKHPATMQVQDIMSIPQAPMPKQNVSMEHINQGPLNRLVLMHLPDIMLT
jgi:hypothetical protein